MRSYGGFVRRVQVRRSVFVGGFSLRVEVRVREGMWFVILLELCGAGGWVDISRKFWALCGWRRSDGALDGRSFLEVANIDGWSSNTVVVEKEEQRRRGCDIEVRADSTEKSMCFLGSCLVGRLENGAVMLPAAMEVQRWAQRSWKVTAGVQVFDLGGFSFLFALPSVEEAQRVVKGQWGFEGRRMKLEWWSPTGCCTKKGDDCSEVWVKILGLPLQLWDVEVFSAIGNFCGSFLYMDEETRLRSHLRWARIVVRASLENIPSTVKIAMGGWTFEVPLWVEKGPRVVFQASVKAVLGSYGGSVARSVFGVQGEDGRR